MKQTEGSEIANVSFDLGAATMEYGNNAPYFTWGRKDPMPLSTGLAKNKPIYGTYTALNNMSTADIAVTIRTPYYFNTSYNQSLELWNVGNTTTTVNVDPVVKSIYDPSPAGFHLPCSGAGQGWDESGRSYWQDIPGKQGILIYQLGPNIGNVVFFPALGYFTNSAVDAFIGRGGNYWTCGAASTTQGRDLSLYSGKVNPLHSGNRGFGFSVRPVSE